MSLFPVQPLDLGSLHLASNVWYAPLAGCSDFPFRKMSKQFSPGLMFCEMVKMDALVRQDISTYHLLDYSEDMHPIGAQLCGSKVALAAPCARIIEDAGFDVLDLNCGCPVDKVTKDNSGSGLLKYPEQIGDILYQMTKAVSIPVTVKIRLGWDEASINAPLITKIAEQAGAKAITIHGRTRAQKYKGNADWSYIKQCKEVANSIKVIGNGDLFSPQDVEAIFQATRCDGVLIARGTLGQGWIAQDIYRHFNNLPPLSFTGEQYRDILVQHLRYIAHYQTGKRALTDLRRVGHWYLKRAAQTKNLRSNINKVADFHAALDLIQSYPWQEIAII